MKKVTVILTLIALSITLFSCSGNGDTSKKTAKKNGFYEPKTQDEFVKLLNDMNIKTYPNAEITNFKLNSNALLTYRVPAKDNSNKDIIDFYKKELKEVFNTKDGWKYTEPTPTTIVIIKGLYEYVFAFSLTSDLANYQLKGGDKDMYKDVKYWEFSISIND